MPVPPPLLSLHEFPPLAQIVPVPPAGKTHLLVLQHPKPSGSGLGLGCQAAQHSPTASRSHAGTLQGGLRDNSILWNTFSSVCPPRGCTQAGGTTAALAVGINQESPCRALHPPMCCLCSCHTGSICAGSIPTGSIPCRAAWAPLCSLGHPNTISHFML